MNLALVLYFIAALSFVAGLAFRRRAISIAAMTALGAGVVANLAVVVLRWIATGHPPLSNLHESFMVVACSIAAVALVVELKQRIGLIGAVSSALAVLAIGYASILDSSIRPLMPALKSNWLIIHVTSYFIGYGALAVATVAAFGCLVLALSRKADDPRARMLDTLSFRLILVAFPFLTIGLTTGAVWANVAWGRYWGWDPKETWSLVTWLVYALYLHLRTMRGWKGTKASIVAAVAFLFVVFTFLGVNVLIGGLHSYR